MQILCHGWTQKKQANSGFKCLICCLLPVGKPSRFDLKPTLALCLTCPSVHLNPSPNPTAAFSRKIIQVGLGLSDTVRDTSETTTHSRAGQETWILCSVQVSMHMTCCPHNHRQLQEKHSTACQLGNMPHY